MQSKEAALGIQKIMWSMLPIVFGRFIWFMGWGLGSSFIPYSLRFIVYAVLAMVIIIYFFGSSLKNASQKYELQFFGYSFWVPSWWFFVILAIVAACLNATPLVQYNFISSLICGVIVSSILEEFITRSFFIKYKMGLKEFLFFNVLSSLAFTFMHTFYEQNGLTINELWRRGHFSFSFLLGIVVYKTQRIELSILLHMLANLLLYTVPIYLFNCPYPSGIALIGVMLVDVVTYLVLAGCTYKDNQMIQAKK